MNANFYQYLNLKSGSTPNNILLRKAKSHLFNFGLTINVIVTAFKYKSSDQQNETRFIHSEFDTGGTGIHTTRIVFNFLLSTLPNAAGVHQQSQQ